MQTNFRTPTASDLRIWSQLRFELWPDCPAERHELEVAQLCAAAGFVALAECDNEVVGFAELSIRVDHVEGAASNPVPYLEGWYVKAAYRRNGIGRGLVAYIEKWVLSEGFSEPASDTELSNETSIELHGKLGFIEVGKTVHFVKKLKAAES